MTSADRYQEGAQVFRFATATNTSGDVAVPERTSFTLLVYSNGLSGAGTAQLVLNADTGANYVNTFINVPAGSVTPANTNSVSQAAIIFTPSQTTAFWAVFKFMNYPTISKAFTYRILYQTADATTTSNTQFGGGEWVNTTAMIKTIRMTTSANNYGAGSFFAFIGGDGL